MRKGVFKRARQGQAAVLIALCMFSLVVFLALASLASAAPTPVGHVLAAEFNDAKDAPTFSGEFINDPSGIETHGKMRWSWKHNETTEKFYEDRKNPNVGGNFNDTKISTPPPTDGVAPP